MCEETAELDEVDFNTLAVMIAKNSDEIDLIYEY